MRRMLALKSVKGILPKALYESSRLRLRFALP